tara:strand:- start:3469 stop:4251 length:783 start_codon:yes stop_codon:yes gene_type:complete
MFKIGKRDFLTFIKSIFKLENYIAIIRFFKVHKSPFKSILNEIFSSGNYPQILHFNSPLGNSKVNLYSYDDFSTFNLIFCRQDYLYTNKQKIILDIGSNIGLSAVFWLTRSKDTIVHCYEPSTENFEKLKKNLQDFDGRFAIFKKAVSSKTFSSFLNLEKSGVYNSINSQNKNKNYFDKEKCDVVSINSCIEKIIQQYGKIDIIKIDNEGEELRTVAAIDRKFWEHIKCINVDGNSVRGYVPRIFDLTRLGSAQRYNKNE